MFWPLINSFYVRYTGTSYRILAVYQRGTMIGAQGTVGCKGTQSQSLPARATEKCETMIFHKFLFASKTLSGFPPHISWFLPIFPQNSITHFAPYQSDSLSLSSYESEITQIIRSIKRQLSP